MRSSELHSSSWKAFTCLIPLLIAAILLVCLTGAAIVALRRGNSIGNTLKSWVRGLVESSPESADAYKPSQCGPDVTLTAKVGLNFKISERRRAAHEVSQREQDTSLSASDVGEGIGNSDSSSPSV